MELVKIYFLIFIIYSMTGWLLEVISTYPDTKCFVNRGFMVGPYCPIYGKCALLMIFLLHPFKKIYTIFIMSVIICSIAEYITSYVMEKLFKARWWDYSKYKYNLNGRICLQNSLLFGVLGVVLIKFINPHVFNFICSLSPKLINILFYSILTIYICDFFVSFKVIMKVKNILNKFNKYIEKNTKNINWQTRYKNLNKKYEEALKEIDDLKLQLDNDRNVNLIKEKNKYIKTLQRQREILREENLRMINNG